MYGRLVGEIFIACFLFFSSLFDSLFENDDSTIHSLFCLNENFLCLIQSKYKLFSNPCKIFV